MNLAITILWSSLRETDPNTRFAISFLLLTLLTSFGRRL